MPTMRRIPYSLFVLAIGTTRVWSATITLDSNTTIGADPPHLNVSFVIVQGVLPPTVVDIVDGANLHGDNVHPIVDVYDGSIVISWAALLANRRNGPVSSTTHRC